MSIHKDVLLEEKQNIFAVEQIGKMLISKSRVEQLKIGKEFIVFFRSYHNRY